METQSRDNTDLAESTPSPPLYNISEAPITRTRYHPQNDPSFPENFTRTAKWCSDGSAVLAQCENRTFQLLDLPVEVAQLSVDNIEKCQRVLPQPASILDFIWYPSASSRDPATFCFVASVRECPVKLLDAADGRVRASYRIVDHRERQIAPHSLSFNLMANKLYCGFEDAIEIFDVHRPGEGTRLHTTPTKQSKEGLRGIISALAFSNNYDFYAAGSFSVSSEMSPNVALFSEAEETPIMFIGTGEHGAKTGVTQLHFHPTKPHILYAAFRRSDTIYSWDLRGDASAPIRVFKTDAQHGEVTNQKMRFDVDLGGKYLSTGSRDGTISLFDLGPDSETDVEAVYVQTAGEVSPSLTFHAHEDAVGSVAFHPRQPFLLSASGSRHFDRADEDDSNSSDSVETEDEDDAERVSIRRNRKRPQPRPLDSSNKIWAFQ
ncbi:hypothetical protein PLICRDRAFT_133117 [Plicaturopsis crispa FD-325 SS-3]|nr:hypothetical protein PLICRDRAFT_133117 [Plicaturopsis crispa FD-325 SS-3]